MNYKFHALVGSCQTRMLISIKCGYDTWHEFNSLNEARILSQLYYFPKFEFPWSLDLKPLDLYLWWVFGKECV
jgi:hypothetical protein